MAEREGANGGLSLQERKQLWAAAAARLLWGKETNSVSPAQIQQPFPSTPRPPAYPPILGPITEASEEAATLPSPQGRASRTNT